MNPVGIAGIEFVEFASPKPDALHALFLEFGFSLTHRHVERNIDLYVQNDIHFLLNRDASGHAASFAAEHGPSICSMGWRTSIDPVAAQQAAVSRGAKSASGEYGTSLPAIYGIGESLIYFAPQGLGEAFYAKLGFKPLAAPTKVPSKGFLCIDHLTNNVSKGTMERWSKFYKEVFGFTEVRYFDIRGAKTGLQSYALRSPDGSFCIPINEATESKSQINEYLEEYRGPGIQHLAFLTNDILASLKAMDDSKNVSFLDMDDEYYQEVFNRVPQVTEDKAEIQKRQVLVDGDSEGYLLQIFTKNIVGPIFVEIIQRKNHLSFGEGNFGALFRSIERDQMKRGYLR